MRLFVALDLSEAVRSALGREVERLRAFCPRIRWTSLRNLHVTVKFLGEVQEHELPSLCDALEGAAGEAAPFSLEVAGLGCFPDLRRPRVVWAGCGSGSEEASALAGRVEEATAALGFERESRRYSPHVTLARVKFPPEARGLAATLEAHRAAAFGEVDVEALTLYLSELARGGVEYTPLHRAPLRG
ncbi:MAG: RNA 2',3'-cyclic phosphodiesterase [Planctomycetota bacterium]